MPESYTRMNDEPTQRRARRSGDGTTRQNLLDAARSVVRTEGIAGASSRAITNAAGANLAAITYHFGSKDDLIAEALFAELERQVTPALDALAAPGDPATVMLGAVQHLLEQLERSKRDSTLYLEALLVATRDPAYAKRARALYRSIRQRLAGVISEMVAAGAIPGWIEPDPMAALILATANGIVMQTSIEPRGPDQHAMATQFAALLLAAREPSDPS